MTIGMNTTDIKIPFAISFLSGFLFLVSGAAYSVSGVSTGYVLVLIGVIVLASAMRMKNGIVKDVKDGSLAVIFFGILNIISFVFILSGTSAISLPFISGFLASVLAITGGCLAFLYSKNKNPD
jgi:hypothetical protein